MDYRLAKHRERVTLVAGKVKKLARDGVKYRIYHKTTNSTRISTRDANAIIDISGLNNIITINEHRRCALVEPNVSMDALVTATLKHGLIPAVVPEFPGITVGGAVSGTALESSSFRYGHFDKAVASVEVILGNGAIVVASPVQNPDLFDGLAGACGTLGTCTLIEIKLIEARKFVELKFLPVSSAAEALNTLKRYTDGVAFIDFIDAIMFGPNHGAVIIGTMTDEKKPGVPIVRFTRAHDPWFYLHSHASIPHARHTDCETCIYSESRPSSMSSIVTNLVPIKDYLFRYDRAAFWMGTYGRNPKTFNRITQFLINPLMKSKALYAGLHHSGQAQSFIIQDITLPENRAGAFLAWAHENIRIYPLWICPVRAITDDTRRSNGHRFRATEILINVGLWGVKAIDWPGIKNIDGPEAFEKFVRDNREIEKATRDLGGVKMLYAHNYYTEEQFWSMYDKEAYDELRNKWSAGGLPSLWDKLGNPQPTYMEKSTFFKCVFKTIMKRDYVLKKGH
ncbi:FAD binding domain-containing protein [Colletotrichum orchidophilum]|uniref:Delta(24)-sterol reductase n=1 Tax=Colletotrichum orchidophilum TaxID=1209926 RepID=A0A1G4BRH0_9PEZI|nr:FAD binding domain-containing protein [Colletotrichum orchidophilum]OHF03886.1 FAD binding domain-containing protein [Colletotrichum orchidophilum]